MFNVIRADRMWSAYKFAPELIMWRDAVIAHGGARPSIREMLRRNRLIHNKITSGAWRLTDDILMSGEDEVQSLVSLKRRFLCIRWNSPEFYSESGFVLDGYAKYIEWPFVPATHAVAMTATNQRLAVYDLANVGTNAFALSTSGGGAGHGIRPLQNENMRGTFGSVTVNFALPEFTSRGLSIVSRSGGDTMRGYKDGARLPDGTGLAMGSGLSTVSFFIGGQNFGGTQLVRPLECVIPYAEIGAQLTDAQEAATYRGVHEAVGHMSYTEDDGEDA